MKKNKNYILLTICVLTISCQNQEIKRNDIDIMAVSVPKIISSYNDLDKNIEYKLALNNFYTNDKHSIELTQLEFDSISNMNTNDDSMIRYANSKGIILDNGLIPIIVSNKKMIMVTYKFDFGTILTLESIERDLGRDIMNHFKEWKIQY
jgi:hypothetical protein